MKLLEELHNMLICNLRESTDDPRDSSHTEFTSLIEVQASPLQRIQEFYELLFEHDDIKNFFLNHVGKDTDRKASLGSKKLSDLLTLKVTQMVSSAPEDGVMSEAATYFKDRTLKYISNVEQSIKSTVLLSCVAAFSNHFTSQEVSVCLRFLLHLPVTALVKEQNLTTHGQWIVRFIRTLMKETPEVFISKCSVDILRSLVKLIQETGNTGIVNSVRYFSPESNA